MISILAPYGRNEVTSAAIRLADLALALGRDVRLVACGLKEKKVHPAWDDKVRSGHREGIYKCTHKAAVVVHFGLHQSWHEKATLVAEKKGKQILVPGWHGLVPKDRSLMPRYDQIVCPSRTCRKLVQSDVFENVKMSKDKLTHVRWDAGLPAIRREGTVVADRIRACFFADASSIDFCGPMVVQLTNELLDAYPKLDVTVLSTKSWSRHDRHDLRAAERKWQKRLAVRRATCHTDLNKEFHSHDWVVLPSVRADFGMAASRALACGAPVICHDVAPFDEIVTAWSGLLVPCEVRTNAFKSPIAVPNIGNWLTTCAKAFSDTRHLFNLQTRDWQLSEAQAAFNLAWTKVWEP